jgi:hypothetical protein
VLFPGITEETADLFAGRIKHGDFRITGSEQYCDAENFCRAGE